VNNQSVNEVAAEEIVRKATRLARLEQNPVPLVAARLALEFRDLGVGLKARTRSAGDTVLLDPRKKKTS
jgi:hypothetical protein